MESIVFHAKKRKEDKIPLFTARFAVKKEIGIEQATLYCVVSKPHPRLESYSKKDGNRLTEARLSCLEREVKSATTVTVASKKELARFLPNGTASVLHFYADRARRYFKVENPMLVVRGTKVTWSRGEWGSKAEKQTAIISTRLSEIAPKED